MRCKYCESENVVKNGSAKGEPIFKCKDCGHRFTEGSDFPKMRTQSRVISSSIDMYFEGLSVRKIQTQIKKLFGVDVSQMLFGNG
jgi:transposase-like protein